MKNSYRVDGDLVFVELTQGQVAIISLSQLPKMDSHPGTWCAQKVKNTFYAITTFTVGPIVDGKRNRKRIYLHRFLLDAPDGVEVDHKDWNGLNCISENLRLATVSQNSFNVRLRRTNKSGYTGVYWDSHAGKWRAKIRVNRHRRHLGLFDSAEQAARAYDDAAKKHRGEFVCPNFTVETVLSA